MAVIPGSGWGLSWGGFWGAVGGESDSTEKLWALMPQGTALDRDAEILGCLLDGMAVELDRLYDYAENMRVGIDPRVSSIIQQDWVDLFAPNDPFTSLIDNGSQSVDIYLEIALALGYTDLTFRHAELYTCQSACDAPLYTQSSSTLIIVEGTSQGDDSLLIDALNRKVPIGAAGFQFQLA